MSAAKLLADFDIRQIEQLPAEIDADVPGIGNVLGSRLAGDLLLGQAIVIGNALDDLVR